VTWAQFAATLGAVVASGEHGFGDVSLSAGTGASEGADVADWAAPASFGRSRAHIPLELEA